MNKVLDKLERKIGKYSIKNLPLVLLIIYATGYVMQLINPNIIYTLSLNPYAIIHKYQYWRLFTWILIPPEDTNLFFVLIMLYFYYSIGKMLERTWGDFYFNFYFFTGYIFTILGSFVMYWYVERYGIYTKELGMAFSRDYLDQYFSFNMTSVRDFAIGGSPLYAAFSLLFSTYYINMSLFLAYAVAYSDMTIMLYFILPIKVYVLGIIYGILIVIEVINSFPYGLFTIVPSLINFIVFFILTKSGLKRRKQNRNNMMNMFKAKAKEQEAKKHAYKANSISKHKCAICGRTNDSNPELEFRFCSKCEGNFEYCQDHLFTHQHKNRYM